MLPEHTQHLVYLCPLTQQLWDTLAGVLTEVFSLQQAVNISHDNIFFNIPPENFAREDRRDVIDVIMLSKHAIYRLKFRDNLIRLPSIRLLSITIALDLEKVIKVRSHFNENSQFLTLITNKLKQLVKF